jgi:SAM-dependent methyltransferase
VHWSSISSNPNLPELLRLRAVQLARARQRPVRDRVDFLCTLAKGKRVLDVGVVNHFAETQEEPNWLHGRLSQVATYLFGVDIVEAGILELQEKGYNVGVCDITSSMPVIEGQYDVIICGELIEHLGNPGGLFEAARRLLLPGGTLVLTTPNPFYIGRVMRHLFNIPLENVDHVAMLFPSGIAELAARVGMELTAFRGVYPELLTIKRRLFVPFRGLLCAATNYEAACDTLIYECTNPALK